MGICTSCTSNTRETAKLILQDGSLQEFSHPTKVSYILSKDPNIFVCNSDEMEFDDVITPVREDDELQPGQLYFALPLTKLSRPLQAVEMAALAVKANAALLKTVGGETCSCWRRPGFFDEEGGIGREGMSLLLMADDLRSADIRSPDVRSPDLRSAYSGNNGSRSSSRRMFLPNNLSVIPE